MGLKTLWVRINCLGMEEVGVEVGEATTLTEEDVIHSSSILAVIGVAHTFCCVVD